MSWVMGQHRCLRWILTEFVALCSQCLLSIGGKPCFFCWKTRFHSKKNSKPSFSQKSYGYHVCWKCLFNTGRWTSVDSNSSVFAATTSPAFNKDLSAREVEGWAMLYQRGPLGSLGPPLGHSRLGLFILCASPVVTIVVMTGMTTGGPLIPGAVVKNPSFSRRIFPGSFAGTTRSTCFERRIEAAGDSGIPGVLSDLVSPLVILGGSQCYPILGTGNSRWTHSIYYLYQ